MYYSKIVSCFLLVIICTGWPLLFSLSVIEEKSTSPQFIKIDSETSIQNNFRIDPETSIRSETSEQDVPAPNHRVVQELGDTRLFWVPDLTTTDPLEFYQINTTLKAISEHSLVYSNLSSSYDSSLEQLKNNFENTVYPEITTFFGAPPDIDANDKVIILAFDIIDGLGEGQFVAGFFYSLNQYNNSEFEHSNEAEIIHVDKLAVSDFETVAHEFQHMLHFGHDYNENVWLDEGASMFAEYLVGKDPFSEGTYKSRFSSNPDVSLTYWDYSDSESLVMANYGAAYAFFLYLAEHYGGSSIIQDVVQNSTDGIFSVEQALESNGYAVEFKEVFRNWTIANFLDDLSFANGAYGYSDISLSMSVEDSYWDLTIPPTENSVPFWGTDYLKFNDRTGLPFILDFQGKAASDFLVTAILTNITIPNTVVLPIEITQAKFGHFSLESVGISADEIILAISSYTPIGENDYSDDGPAPAQDYWIMINPQGIIITSGILKFSATGSSIRIGRVKVSDQNGFYWEEADGGSYQILTEAGNSTGICGNFTFNSKYNFWESKPIDISTLPAGNNTYRIRYHFFNSTFSGFAYSETFQIIQDTVTEPSSSTTTNNITLTPGFVLVISFLTIGILISNRKKK